MTPFYNVVADLDRNLFSVYGPMTDDRILNNKVCDAIATGRKIKVANCGTSYVDRRLTLREAQLLFPGYTEVPRVV